MKKKKDNRIPIRQWTPTESTKQQLYSETHWSHEDGDILLTGMRTWWDQNQPNALRLPTQWEALARGWLRNPKSMKHAHKHTWLCKHTLNALNITREQASTCPQLCQTVAQHLNAGETPHQATQNAKATIKRLEKA